jgi:hypothetical protein
MKMVYGRVLSRESAISELGLNYVGDYRKIQQEWEEEIRIKAEIPAEVKAEYGSEESIEEEKNPDKPGIDNNDKGKSIAE